MMYAYLSLVIIAFAVVLIGLTNNPVIAAVNWAMIIINLGLIAFNVSRRR